MVEPGYTGWICQFVDTQYLRGLADHVRVLGGGVRESCCDSRCLLGRVAVPGLGWGGRLASFRGPCRPHECMYSGLGAGWPLSFMMAYRV